MEKRTDMKAQAAVRASCGARIIAALALTALQADAVQATKRTTAETAAIEAQFVLKETPAEKAARMAWWTHDRFGMFIHFGLYAAPAGPVLRAHPLRAVPCGEAVRVRDDLFGEPARTSSARRSA